MVEPGSIVMKQFAKFEICGLHFILHRLNEVTQFQLCDEAFSRSPIRFSARSDKALYDAVEAFAGLELTEEAQIKIRTDLGPIRRKGNNLRGLHSVFGRSTAGGLPQEHGRIAIGM